MLSSLLQRSFLAFAVTLFLSDTAHAAVFYPTSFTLDNGLQVVVVPNHLAPAVNQMVWYKVGSADEEAGKRGLAHYLEHLMFRGTTTMAPGEFSKTIAAQGGDDNAFTSFDYTAYHETVAADRLPMIMQMEANRMQNLQINNETAKPELSVVLSERQQRTDNSPEGRFGEKARQILLPQHPYGSPVIGWKNEIEKLQVVDAVHFYKKHYAPNNVVVIISGDVDPENVKQLATKIYGAVPRVELAPRAPVPSSPKPTIKRFEMVDAGVEQPQLELSIVVPSYTTQKSTEAYAYEVLAEALDGGEVGELYRRLVKQQGMASGVDASYDPDTRGDAVFSIGATPQPGKTPYQLEKALQATLHKLAKDGLDDKAIDRAKQRLIQLAVFARDSLMAPGYAFGMAISTGHTIDDVEAWPERIEHVRSADVNTALRALIANDRRLLASLLPDPKATAAARHAAQPLLSGGKEIR